MADSAPVTLTVYQDLRETSRESQTLPPQAAASLDDAIHKGLLREIKPAEMIGITRENYEKHRVDFPEGKEPRIFIHSGLPQSRPAFIAFGILPQSGPVVLISEAGHVWSVENVKFSTAQDILSRSEPFPQETDEQRMLVARVQALAGCAGVSPPPVILAGPKRGGNVAYSPATAAQSSDGQNFIFIDPTAPLDTINSGLEMHENKHLLTKDNVGQRAVDAHNDPVKVNQQYELDADALAAKFGFGPDLRQALVAMYNDGRKHMHMSAEEYADFQKNFDLDHPPQDIRLAALDAAIQRHDANPWSMPSCKLPERGGRE